LKRFGTDFSAPISLIEEAFECSQLISEFISPNNKNTLSETSENGKIQEALKALIGICSETAVRNAMEYFGDFVIPPC
jgi:hypothetical protein